MPELPRPLPPPTWRDRLAVLSSWHEGVPLPALVVVLGVVVAISIGVATTTMRSTSKPDVALSLPRADTATESTTLASPTTVVGPLHVHAAGAVARPGVVQVPTGARVIDVIDAAGGAAPDADLNQINLAELVADGERVYIPRVGEVVAAFASSSSAGKGSSGASAEANDVVNINQASETELEALPGVGPATAKAIVDYRTQNGPFRSVEDLLNVRGIGPAKLEQIKPHARV